MPLPLLGLFTLLHHGSIGADCGYVSLSPSAVTKSLPEGVRT